MRLVFVGTDDIGALALKEIIGSSHEVLFVISQPDRPKGRGKKITPGPVRQVADEYDIRIYQPESIREDVTRNAIIEASPDIMVVVSYGEYIPSKIFKAPEFGSINLHPSLLPRWRGAAPVRYALLAGDEVTGVTVQYLHKRMDAGDILAQVEVPIEPVDDHGSLCDRLHPLGAKLVVEVLDRFDKKGHEIESYVQDEEKITQAPKITKDDLWIDWTRSAVDVRNKIRAFAPSPGARAQFRGELYKILRVEDVNDYPNEPVPGLIYGIPYPIVDCVDKGLKIITIQPPGKKPIDGADFRNGYRLADGEMFGGKELLSEWEGSS